uniref:Integrase catalytic domain-containing protein n=1 Tax=Tanacetum cinerariifolium TaxID=118510 RepID=A0A699GXS7_TANCI|nr:hypothetical protein [Tanacetum cinerariifolium]
MHKAFPLLVIEFPLAEEVPTASEESFHYQMKREATAVKIALLLKSRRNYQLKSDDSYAKLVPHVTPCILGITVIVTSFSTSAKTTDTARDGTSKKKGRTVTVTADDMQRRKNDVKTRTTLLLSLPDEHQLRFKHGFISSTKHNRRNEDVTTASVSTASTNVPTASTNVGVASISQDTACAYIASQFSGSQIKFKDINQIDEDDIEEMNIKWNMALLSMMADRECRAPRNQDRGRRHNYRQVSKVKEKAPKALMAIDGVRWDWSYMTTDEENHALVAKKEAPIEFSLMANTSAKSKTGLPDFKNDTVTDYSRPAPTVESSSDDAQNKNPFVTKEASPSTIPPKSFIKFVKANDSPTKSKIDKVEKAKKSPIKKRVKKGTSRSQNNTHKSFTARPAVYKPYRHPMRPMRSNMNSARPNRTSFNKPAHSYINRPFQRTSVVKSQYRAPWVPTVNRNFPPVNRKFSTVNRKFPTANRKFPTGGTKFHTTDMGKKGNADSGCSRHMIGNISYLSDFKPFDRGYVSFGQGGCKITECIMLSLNFKLSDDDNVLLRTPRQYNMYSIDLNNIVPYKDLTCLVAKASADECMLWHRRLGKQHKASCKSKLVNSVSKPLYTLHIDLFGPTSDETSGILSKFITKIENIKDLKVKIIRCDNGGEFRNKEMNDFCSHKGIKREFSNARTPQQNGVAERRNRTRIEATRTMLANTKLSVTFWAEAVNTSCYVQNRVLVNKSQNKTPYELFNSRTPTIGFLKSFGCHVMILNTLENLGKFKAKQDEGYFIGYSMSNKTFRIFNKRTKKVEENLHVKFLENKAIEKGTGPNWLFDIDSLTKSMNYVPVDAGINYTNLLGTKDVASQEVKNDVSSLRYIALPNWVHDALLESSSSKPQDDCSADVPESSVIFNPTATSKNPPADQLETLTVETPIPIVSLPVTTSYFTDSPEPSSDARLISKRVANQVETPSLDNIINLANRFEDILGVTTNSNESNGVEADTLVDCPKGVRPIGTKWVFKNKKDERGIVIKNKARLVAQGHTQEDGIDYDEVFSPVARIEAIILFLAYASFMGFTVYQMDVKSAFLYGTIDEEVYVMQPPGFQDPEFLVKVYKRKDGNGKDIDLHLYRSMIGSLMYLTASRPDIMFAIYACAHHQASPLRYALTFKPTIYVSHIRQFWSTARIKTTEEGTKILAIVDDEPASPLKDVSEGEAFPTDSGFEADHDRANIAKTSTLPYDSAPRVTSPVSAEGRAGNQHIEAERVSDDTKEIATVLTSMDATTVLASGVAKVPTGSRSIPTSGPPATEVPTGSDVVPTASLIFVTATVVTPYKRRKGKEIMVESKSPKKKKVARDAEIARIHAEEELHSMIDGLDKSNETLEDFIPMGSKEEAQRLKRKGLSLEQQSVKKLKTSEEVTEEANLLMKLLKKRGSEELLEDHKAGRQLSQLPILYGPIEAYRQGRSEQVMGLSERISQ